MSGFRKSELIDVVYKRYIILNFIYGQGGLDRHYQPHRGTGSKGEWSNGTFTLCSFIDMLSLVIEGHLSTTVYP